MKLREWRKRTGLSGGQAAKLVGTAQSHWSGIETGKKTPSPKLAEQIEIATNGQVTVAELLGLSATKSLQRVHETGSPSEPAPVKVAVPGDLAEMAGRYGLDVESLIAEGGIPRLRAAFKAAYIARHKEAIDQISASVRKHGTLSERMGMI